MFVGSSEGARVRDIEGEGGEPGEAPARRTVLAATAGLTATLGLGALGSGRAHADVPHDDRLRALIARMSLEEKVGQLFVSRVYGHSATAPDQADIDANLEELGVRTAAELVEKYHVGGVIYFTWAHNTRDPHQIAALSNGIQKASLARPNGLPVLIGTDQEHGIVARVGKPATLFPGAMALGAAWAPAPTPVRSAGSPAPSCTRSASARTTPPSPT